MYLPECKMTVIEDPPNKRCLPKENILGFAKKKYFTINFIDLIHRACQILPTFTNKSHCLSS